MLKHARVVGLSEIEENEFNLNIPRYVDTFEPEPRVEVKDALKAVGKAEADAIQAQETYPFFWRRSAMRPTDALPHPGDWVTTTVRESVDIKRGVSWSKDQESALRRDGAEPVIRIGNVQGRLELDDLLYVSGLKPAVVKNKRVLAGWTIIVGSNGNRARVGNSVLVRSDTELLFASFLLGAKPKGDSELSPECFYRWLSTEQVQAYLSASSEGTTGLNNLSHSFFRAMRSRLRRPMSKLPSFAFST